MKVIVLSFGFINYTIPLANALSEIEKNEIFLMEPLDKIDKYKSLIRKNVRLYTFQNRYRIRDPRNFFEVLALFKKIKFVKPHILHIQRGFPWVNIFLPLIKDIKIVTTIHDVYQHPGDMSSRRVPTVIQDLIVKYSDHIIVHGNHLYEQMIEKHKIIDTKIDVVCRGDYADFFNFQSSKTKIDICGRKIILFFGRIWGYKGLQYLIQAQPMINRIIPDAKIVIAGSGEEFTKYKRLITDESVFIIYNKHIPNDEVADLFHKSSVIVLPYIEASQSGIIPLAYAYRKPVVTTNVGCLPEIVENGKTGFIVEPKNPKQLAAAILKILNNENLQKEFGRNGYMKLKNELSWSNAAKKTNEIYKKVLIRSNYI